jgi:hypothetical protein
VRIVPHARIHGVPDADMLHAVRHAIATDPTRHDDRTMFFGPDPAGNLLEVLVAVDADEEVIIHAQRITARNMRFLP